MTDRPWQVLLVDGEPAIRRLLRTGFELKDYRVVEAATAKAAIETAVMNRPDLVVLDLDLPDADGSTVLARLRGWSEAGVIVLSARDSESEKVRLFDLGTDDYVVKPFGMAELLARARAVLGRLAVRAAPQPALTIDDLTIDFVHRLVAKGGRTVRLAPREYRLLHLLATNIGKVMTHRQLVKELWPKGVGEDLQYLRILVKKLRRKIEDNPSKPRLLVTELAVGYRLRTGDQLDAAA